jgi:hypothetical protein
MLELVRKTVRSAIERAKADRFRGRAHGDCFRRPRRLSLNPLMHKADTVVTGSCLRVE